MTPRPQWPYSTSEPPFLSRISEISATQSTTTSSNGRASSPSSWPGTATEYSAQSSGSASASGW